MITTNLHLKVYHILLILTDGQIHDIEAAKTQIVELSNYPCSIIIVQFTRDFKEGEELEKEKEAEKTADEKMRKHMTDAGKEQKDIEKTLLEEKEKREKQKEAEKKAKKKAIEDMDELDADKGLLTNSNGV